MLEPSTPGRRHVALVGPTASGKSELAMALAECRTDAEIVSVDSMAVYRGMDIGTAKPSPAERARVPHHLLDLVDPDVEFTVQQFQRAAGAVVAQIEARGHRALMVTGTGLYLRSVVDELVLPGRWPELARTLEDEADGHGGLERLYSRLAVLDPVAASRIGPGNKRRVVRALEVTLGAGRPFSSFGPGLSAYGPTRVLLVGMVFDPEIHDRAIEERFASMLDAGLLDEVRALADEPRGMSRTARQALGYKELLAHLEGTISLEDATAEAVRRTKVFARRQWSWFKRDPRITWLDPTRDQLTQLVELWDAVPATVVGD